MSDAGDLDLNTLNDEELTQQVHDDRGGQRVGEVGDVVDRFAAPGLRLRRRD